MDYIEKILNKGIINSTEERSPTLKYLNTTVLKNKAINYDKTTLDFSLLNLILRNDVKRKTLGKNKKKIEENVLFVY